MLDPKLKVSKVFIINGHSRESKAFWKSSEIKIPYISFSASSSYFSVFASDVLRLVMSAFCLVTVGLSSVISLFNFLFSIKILETVIWMSTSISFRGWVLQPLCLLQEILSAVFLPRARPPCLLVWLFLVRLLLSLVLLVCAFLPVSSSAGRGGFSALICMPRIVV